MSMHVSTHQLPEEEKAFYFWQKLSGEIEDRGGSKAAMNFLVKTEGWGLVDAIARLVVEAERRRGVQYRVVTRHSSCKEVIEAGNYGLVESIVNELFDLIRKFDVDDDLVLYRPPRGTNTLSEVLEQLDGMGLRSATLLELCAFGEVFPNVQIDFNVKTLVTRQKPLKNLLVCLCAEWNNERQICVYAEENKWFAWNEKQNLYLAASK